MMRLLPFLAVLLIFTTTTLGQRPNKPTSSEIFESVQKLNFLGSVLYVAAHPDDENTRLIAYMANEIKARTAYLSLTRGDGGQNLIGPELRELLGVIRTQELLAARRVDGGEQIFSRANDFGYSKHPDETLAIWDKDKVLSDVVRAIREFKPDVIINRFDHRRAGKTHGHHTTSALLSMEAFEMTNDASVYPEQLETLELWQPKRLFYNTSWWRYGSRENFAKIDKSNMVALDIGVYYPQKGLSNNELASIASSQHLCQGFGRMTTRGTQLEYIEFLKGEPLNGDENIFAGIDTSWNRIEGGSTIGEILTEVEGNFNFQDPSVHLPDLMKAYQLLSKVENEYWRDLKLKELKTIIEACAGLYFEVSAESNWATSGEVINLDIEAINRSNQSLSLRTYQISEALEISKELELKENIKYNFKETITIPKDQEPTTPYWLAKKGTIGMYEAAEEFIGEPETPRQFNVEFNVVINAIPITFTKPVIYRYSRPDKGELYKPFEIIPEATASFTDNVYIFNGDLQKEVEVIVKAGRKNLEGSVELCYPDDWNVSPSSQKVSIANKGDVQKFVFTITAPDQQSEGYMSPMVKIGDQTYTSKLVEIDYAHIPFQTVLLPSESKLVKLDIEKQGNNIGYIKGAGDVVPESLEQIGYKVITIEPNDISPESLNQFDAIVVGIRAYNTVEALNFKQQMLFDFVKQGGNMVVQYNKSYGLKTDQLAPYPLELSRDRVTEEDAEVRILEPEHPALNYPNKITVKDFEGWTQERGLYFPDEWSEEFIPLLSMNDKGETPKQGSLLVAKHGDGYFVYTGLSFFREFPAGVSGAYRIFTNLLSLGKNNTKTN
ncbi:MAG: PIG-L family deacetylase [Psychroserpens sp.]|nr:PIG-L family deacetylase [Psychroserpens sp.]